MNATAAIAQCLLEGRVINIKRGFYLFGVTNLPREIGRCIEKKFKIRLERKWRDGYTRYGIHCRWMDYWLKRKKMNTAARKRMRLYVRAKKDSDLQIFFQEYLAKKMKVAMPKKRKK